MWEINNGNGDELDCYDNTNYIDEALKKCKHLSTFYDWFTHCDRCCNRSICEQYATPPIFKVAENPFGNMRITIDGVEQPLYISTEPAHVVAREYYDVIDRYPF